MALIFYQMNDGHVTNHLLFQWPLALLHVSDRMCDKCEIVRNWWKSYLLTDGTVILKFCLRSYVLNVIWICLSVSLCFDDSYMARRAQPYVGPALTRLLTRNNSGETWRRICLPDIQSVSAEVLLNCALQIDIYLLTYLTLCLHGQQQALCFLVVRLAIVCALSIRQHLLCVLCTLRA